VSALIKAVPGSGFPTLLAAYFGAALVFRARMRSESPPNEAQAALGRLF
jgi:hypothetical protein